MAELITKVTFKSGKVINIPVLYKHEGWDYQSIDYGNLLTAYCVVSGGLVDNVYQALTVDEAVQLMNMFTNGNATAASVNYPPVISADHSTYCGIPLNEVSSSQIRAYAPIAIVELEDGTFKYALPFNLTTRTSYMYRVTYKDLNNMVFNDMIYFDVGGSSPENMQGLPFDMEAELRQVYYNDQYRRMNCVYDEIATTLFLTAELTPENVTDNIADYIERTGDENLPELEGIDTDNPYGGTVDGYSFVRGGGINGELDPDEIDPALIPDLPTVSAADAGFITIYNPTIGQLRSLSNYLWNPNLFDVEQWQKIFADPMEGVIGLSIVPVKPSLAGTIPVMIGNAVTNVSMQKVASQFVELNCGSVTVDPYVNCFLDYDYTKISIYLPYIGLRDLDAADCMGESIKVVYHVDVLTGGLSAIIQVGSKGVLYQFNGNCATDVPITANNFSGAIQNAISAVANAGVIAAGVASGGSIAAMGAVGLMGSAANTVINSRPHIQRSGNLGGSAGLLSVQKPYIIIQRPRLSVPAEINKFVGNTSNITATLGTLHGFTMVEHVHFKGIDATTEELSELETILKAGVIL